MLRGALNNPDNRFLKWTRGQFFPEGIDTWETDENKTIFLEEHAKSIVNKVDSPDVGMYYSMNPYQGCEHGCAYCYARNTHEFWGYSAGIDFEQKIIIKKNAPQLLKTFLMNPTWEVCPLSLSGNTDCYQPAEKKFRITRKLLEVCLQFRQPVSIITKNAFILRDIDLLKPMADMGLVSVLITVNSLNETLRRIMEPRTTTAKQRLKTIEFLAGMGIPAGVMVAPIIPGINDHELKSILESAASAGASFSSYTFIRLNGSVQMVFREWLLQNFADRAEKVWHLIEDGHGGKVSDSRFGIRMRGEGPLAEMIRQQFKKYSQKFNLTNQWKANSSLFCRPGSQLSLFA